MKMRDKLADRNCVEFSVCENNFNNPEKNQENYSYFY